MRARSTAPLVALLASALAFALAGCDDSKNLANDDGGVNGGADAGVDFSDADPNAPDAGPGGCVPGGPQCNNCVDDDGDGKIDGADPECTGAIDNDEASFATGIPGDNIDSKLQDCFFDGNSGAGDDKCKFHTCCILDLSQPQYGGVCPADLQPPNYDPAQCTVTQTCIDNCKPLTPPGCDCFGCCTLCNGSDCHDVYTNPAVAPDCTLADLGDPSKCPVCVKVQACSNPCDPQLCILCPGQSPSDLPPDCMMNPACPTGSSECSTDTPCVAGQYCSNGCCIDQIG
jgi:hypothetical protein